MLASWKESYDQLRQHIKNLRHYFTNKGPSSQSYGFSSSHIWMWELDYKERWVPKNWCFWTVVLEKTLESPLDCKDIQPVHSEGDQSWVFIGRTDAEAENPVLWPLDAKNWLIGKDPDAGKDWKRRRRGWPRMRLLNGITDSMDMSLSKLWELVMVGTWHAAVHEVTKSWTRLSNWRTDWLFPQAVTGIVILWKETLKHCYSILNSLKINLVSCLSLYPAPSEPLCIWVSRNWKAFPFFLAIYSSSFPQNKAQESTN